MPPIPVIDTATGQTIQVEAADVAAGVAAGKYATTDQSVARQESTFGQVPRTPQGAAVAASTGAQFGTGAEGSAKYREAQHQDALGSIENKGAAFALSALDMGTFGLVNFDKGFAGEVREHNKGSSFLGSVVGGGASMLVGGPVAKAAKAAEQAATKTALAFTRGSASVAARAAVKASGEAALGAVIGGVTSFNHQMVDAVIDNKPFSMEALIEEAGFGAIIAGGLGGLGGALFKGPATKAAITGSGGILDATSAESKAIHSAFDDVIGGYDKALEGYAGDLGVMKAEGATEHVAGGMLKNRISSYEEALAARRALDKVGTKGYSSPDPKIHAKWDAAWGRYQNAIDDLGKQMRLAPGEGPVETGLEGLRPQEVGVNPVQASPGAPREAYGQGAFVDGSGRQMNPAAAQADAIMAASPELQAKYEALHGKPWESAYGEHLFTPEEIAAQPKMSDSEVLAAVEDQGLLERKAGWRRGGGPETRNAISDQSFIESNSPWRQREIRGEEPYTPSEKQALSDSRQMRSEEVSKSMRKQRPVEAAPAREPYRFSERKAAMSGAEDPSQAGMQGLLDTHPRPDTVESLDARIADLESQLYSPRKRATIHQNKMAAIETKARRIEEDWRAHADSGTLAKINKLENTFESLDMMGAVDNLRGLPEDSEYRLIDSFDPEDLADMSSRDRVRFGKALDEYASIREPLVAKAKVKADESRRVYPRDAQTDLEDSIRELTRQRESLNNARLQAANPKGTGTPEEQYQRGHMDTAEYEAATLEDVWAGQSDPDVTGDKVRRQGYSEESLFNRDGKHYGLSNETKLQIVNRLYPDEPIQMDDLQQMLKDFNSEGPIDPSGKPYRFSERKAAVSADGLEEGRARRLLTDHEDSVREAMTSHGYSEESLFHPEGKHFNMSPKSKMEALNHLYPNDPVTLADIAEIQKDFAYDAGLNDGTGNIPVQDVLDLPKRRNYGEVSREVSAQQPSEPGTANIRAQAEVAPAFDGTKSTKPLRVQEPVAEAGPTTKPLKAEVRPVTAPMKAAVAEGRSIPDVNYSEADLFSPYGEHAKTSDSEKLRLFQRLVDDPTLTVKDLKSAQRDWRAWDSSRPSVQMDRRSASMEIPAQHGPEVPGRTTKPMPAEGRAPYQAEYTPGMPKRNRPVMMDAVSPTEAPGVRVNQGKPVDPNIRAWFKDRHAEASGAKASHADIAQAKLNEVLNGLNAKAGVRLDASGGLNPQHMFNMPNATTSLGQRAQQLFALRQVGGMVAKASRGARIPKSMQTHTEAWLKRTMAGKVGAHMMGGVIGGGLGGPVGFALGAAMVGQAGQMVGSIAGTAGRVAASIGNAVGKALGGGRSAALGVAIARGVPTYDEQGPVKDVAERIEQINGLASNPEAIAAKVQASLGDLTYIAPDAVKAATDHAINKMQMLKMRAPVFIWNKMGTKIPPAEGKLRRFEDYEAGANSLGLILKNLGDGTLTPAQAEAFRECWPEAHAETVKQFLTEKDQFSKMNPEALQSLERCLGMRMGSDASSIARGAVNWKQANEMSDAQRAAMAGPGSAQGAGGKPQAFKMTGETPTPGSGPAKAPGN